MKEEELLDQLLKDSDDLEKRITQIIEKYPSREKLMKADIPEIEKLQIVQLMNYYMFSSEFLLSKRQFDKPAPSGMSQLLAQIRECEKKLQAL